jgi:succinyl-CoA synthetase beta subunit
MNLLEHQGKRLLGQAGLRVPRSRLVADEPGAEQAAAEIGGRVVLKAQVPTGKRGKAGAILFADSPTQARALAGELLGSEVGGFPVRQVLVEESVDIDLELYAAVLNDAETRGPLLLFSTAGGMDIEEVNATTPDRVLRLPVDITRGLDEHTAQALVAEAGIADPARTAVADALVTLYGVYRQVDAELAEINPLVLTRDGEVVALDAKISVDQGSLPRQQALVEATPADTGGTLSALEAEGRDQGFLFIELDGDVGILANGAGLTMTTLDVVTHYGGSPANFLEIGGDAYTRATPALRLVLDNPRVRSLLVNFCGAFARTDVMTEGVVKAIEELRPDVPAFFTIHGTGEEEAIQLVRDRLGVEPYDQMDDAVRAAVAAATTTGAVAGEVR